MINRFAYLLAALALAASTVPVAISRAQEAETPAAMLILDASGSMWAKVDDGHKIILARKALRETLTRHDGALSLGLVAYGHRAPPACQDIELLAPLKPLDAKRQAAIVDAIRPKGATPIGAALEKAATAGKSRPDLNMLLIADGLDNCGRDPCAIAAELKKTAPALRIHVIAFGEPKLDLGKLSCIAEETGGGFARADSGKSFAAALGAAFEALIAPLAVAAASGEQPDADAEPVGSIDDAKITDLNDPGWIASDVDEAGEIELSPGVRVAQAQLPDAAAEPAGAGGGAGTAVTLSALVTEAGPKIESGVVWRIFHPKPAGDGGYRLISTHRDAAPTASLPPGEYLVNAAYGLSNLTKRIKVEAGKPLSESFVLNTGGLKLNAVLANGSQIVSESVRYDIFVDETDQFGNRKRLLENAKPGVVLRLNSGVYHIVSTFGDANAIVRADVTIEPGKLSEATINHAAAQISFKLVAAPGGEALADTRWKVTSSGGDVIKESAGALPSHILAAGDYTVTAQHADMSYTREFKVESGAAQQVEVVMK